MVFFRKGEEVIVLPSGFTSKIKDITLHDQEIKEAFPPMSVSITLEDEIDISRGDMIAKPNNQPEMSQDIDIMVCWMSNKPLTPRGKYVLKHTSNEARAMIKDILYKMDINTLHKMEDNLEIKLNDIARISLRASKPLCIDTYRKNRATGSLILVDEFTNETVAAGMVI